MSNRTDGGLADRISIPWLDGALFTTVAGSVVLIAAASLVQIRYGAYPMTFGQAWNAVFDPAVLFDRAAWRAFLLGGDLPAMERRSLIVWTLRVPRILVALLVGANLAISGAIFQAITRNELASPYVLGVSSGAGFAILLTLAVFAAFAPYLPLVAALGGVVAFLLVYLVAWQGGTSPVRLVLAGIVVGTAFQSLQTGLFFFLDDIAIAQSAMAWMTGSLTDVRWAQVRVALPFSTLALGLALAGHRQLNVLLLGERTASSLGMSVETVRFGLSVVAIVAASTAIAVAGVVGFVGLIVPHVVRTLVGTNYRRLLVGCAFVGPALVLLADVVGRLALSPQEIPVGVVTGLVGAPYFLYLMRRKQLGEL